MSTTNLPRNSLAKNINTTREKKDAVDKKKRITMKKKAFLKMITVIAGLHNTASAADRLLPNITMGKKGEFAQYNPSLPFRANTFSKSKYNKITPLQQSQKTTKKHIHRGGRKHKKTRKY